MKRPYKILALFSVLALFVACGGSKSLSKKGEKLEEAGLYQESANLHYQALLKKPHNIDAQIGLKKNGQMVLNDGLEDFFKSMTMGDNETAVSNFLELQDYFNKVKKVGVTLDIPDHYYEDFKKVKGEFITTLYTAGTQQLEDEDFANAERTLGRIVELEPDYKDAKELRDEAYMEPLYREGKISLEEEHYRAAYDRFEKVQARGQFYKDVAALKAQTLKDGSFAIAVLPFKNTVTVKVAPKVVAHTTNALANLNDPFLKIVDRENIDRILEEQRLGLSGVVDESTAVEVGELMGAQAVLMGTIIDYREESGNLKKSSQKGFESYRVKLLNSETQEYYYQTRYKQVAYYEYFQENRVYLSVSYKLVSLKTGELLASSIVEETKDDHIYYATYGGDKDKLYPSKDGKVDTSSRNRKALRALLKANRKVKPISTLAADTYKSSSNKIAQSIGKHLQDSDL